jgi:hypothetical protein
MSPFSFIIYQTSILIYFVVAFESSISKSDFDFEGGKVGHVSLPKDNCNRTIPQRFVTLLYIRIQSNQLYFDLIAMIITSDISSLMAKWAFVPTSCCSPPRDAPSCQTKLLVSHPAQCDCDIGATARAPLCGRKGFLSVYSILQRESKVFNWTSIIKQQVEWFIQI